MTTINKQVIVPYSDQQMFRLVADIANYSQYLPWCSASTVNESSNRENRSNSNATNDIAVTAEDAIGNIGNSNSRSFVAATNSHEAIGTIYIEYFKIKTHFTTRNIYSPYKQILISLVDGPFKELTGTWQFTPLGNGKDIIGCKIDFLLCYVFNNSYLEKIVGPVFNYIGKNMVDGFVKEAKRQYQPTLLNRKLSN